MQRTLVVTPSGEIEFASDTEAELDDNVWREVLLRLKQAESKHVEPARFACGDVTARLQRVAGPSGIRYIVQMEPLERASNPLQALTERQREVAELLVCGATNAEIARHLKVSDETVRSHVKRIYRRLHIASRVELASLVAGEIRLARNS